MKSAENRIVIGAKEGNMTPIIQDILEGMKDGTVLSFEKGEYHFFREGCFRGAFFPSNNAGGVKDVVFSILNKRDIYIEGNGAEFIFHGKIFPFIIQNSQNIKIENVTVDFAFPRVYQAEVLEACEEYLDIFIDKKKFPYTIEKGEMILNLEENDLVPESIYFFPYDAKIGRTYGKTATRYNMAYFSMGANCRSDGSMGARSWSGDNRYFQTDAYEIGENTVRLVYREGSNRMFYDKGDRLVLQFQRLRDNGTFFLDNCKNVDFEKVTIYRGGCMGINAQLCEDMSFSELYIGCKEGRGDLVSTTADAFMLTDCSGKVTLKNSYLADSLDDGINVHGTYMPIESMEENTIVHCLAHVEQCGFNPLRVGDHIAVVDEKTLDILVSLTVEETKLCEDNKHIITRVKENIPGFVKPENILYNLDRMPEMEIVDNEFRNVPALLLGTSKPTLFARNKVNTRNEALRLVDCATWVHEVARKKDLMVEDNEFVHCTEWYDLPVIYIVERLQLEKPKKDIHQDMVFRRNKFIGKNGRLFYIEYSSNVEITDNVYENTNENSIEGEMNPFKFVHCQNIVVNNNRFML